MKEADSSFPKNTEVENSSWGYKNSLSTKNFLQINLQDIAAFTHLEEAKNTMRRTALKFNFAHVSED